MSQIYLLSDILWHYSDSLRRSKLQGGALLSWRSFHPSNSRFIYHKP